MTAPNVPPNTFCLIPNPFRPGGELSAMPGLQESVEDLVKQGMLRSALDRILAVLDADPDNQQALRLAMIVFGAIGRTQQVNAAEALTPRYFWDCRFDSIFAVCSSCRRTSWVPDECVYAYAEIAAENAVGLQCRQCGFIMCRKCLQQTFPGFQGSNLECPNCAFFGNGKPVFPTGRRTLQLKRFGAPVQLVLLFREGPVPPSDSYARTLLDKLNPDPLSAEASIITMPLETWTDTVGSLGFSMLDDLAKNGRLIAGTFERGGEIVTDDDGLRVAIFRIIDLPPEKQFESRLSTLEAELKAQPRSGPRFLRQLMRDHLHRVSEQCRSQPAYRRSTSLWAKLISPPAYDTTIDALNEIIPKANQTGQHVWKALQLDTLLLIVSAIPSSDPATVRKQFPGGYFSFMEGSGLLAHSVDHDIVHWILCADSEKVVIHLLSLPLDHRSLPLQDLDILSEAEQASLNL